jgi:hypothetical protein
MAQSALTVTTPNPTPPTNMAFTGATPPNVPNYTKNTYNDPKNWSYVNPKDFPPPYFDDGAAGPLHTYATNTAALASGTTAANTAGGTGVDSTTGSYGAIGVAVPASTSVAHEGAGTETRVLAPGNINYAYVVGTLDMSQSVSDGPVATQATRDAGPNATHASTMSPVTNPALASISPTTLAAALTGTQLITCTGTGFVNGCRIWHDGVEQTTTFVSATSITATVKKRTSAAAVLVDVKLGGVAVPTSRTFTWT